MRSAWLLACLMALHGCAYHNALYEPAQINGRSLNSSSRVCVLRAGDGIYQGDPYEGSGAEISARTRNALAAVIPGTALAEATSQKEGRAECLKSGADYLITPTIQHWEDRATQWSGLRDLIRIRAVLEKSSPEPRSVIRTGYFEARNGWFTFVNHPPEELLADDDAYFWFVRGLVGMPEEKKK